jgi:hypothetical protein
MNCSCLEKRHPSNFKDWQDYHQFKEDLFKDQSFKEIPVTSPYADVGLIET